MKLLWILVIVLCIPFQAKALDFYRLNTSNMEVRDPLLKGLFKVENYDNGNYKLNLFLGGKVFIIAESGKPNFNIYHAANDLIVVLSPVGFCTPAAVVEIDSKIPNIKILYASHEKTSIDYSLKSYDEAKRIVVLARIENLRESDEDREPKQLADIKIPVPKRETN